MPAGYTAEYQTRMHRLVSLVNSLVWRSFCPATDLDDGVVGRWHYDHELN